MFRAKATRVDTKGPRSAPIDELGTGSGRRDGNEPDE